MKTHQEIHDAIEAFRKFTFDNDNADILHALNDRIAHLEHMLKTPTQLEEER